VNKNYNLGGKGKGFIFWRKENNHFIALKTEFLKYDRSCHENPGK
jgi:hypothetical protein